MIQRDCLATLVCNSPMRAVIVSAALLSITLAACTSTRVQGSENLVAEPTPLLAEPEALKPEATQRRDPRAQAARGLVEEGQTLLRAGKLDDAMRTFERAVAMDSNSAESSYWLAECWHQQGDQEQAREYHRRARRGLAAQSQWQQRLRQQARVLGLTDEGLAD